MKKRQNNNRYNVPHFDPLINRITTETKEKLLALKDQLIRKDLVAQGAIKT